MYFLGKKFSCFVKGGSHVNYVFSFCKEKTIWLNLCFRPAFVEVTQS